MIVAIVNQKGGTGKTTTTINLGAALTQAGKKILLIDMDAQGNLSYSLGYGSFDKGMPQLLLGTSNIDEALISTEEGMDLLPSDINLADSELSLIDVEGREYIFKKICEQLPEYDYVLVDCPPSLSLLTVNVLAAADRVIVPMQMEVLSLQGLDLINETIGKITESFNPNLKILGILPVMVDSRRKLSAEVLDHIKENYSIPVFDSRIRGNVKASEAPSFGMSVIAYAPQAASAKDYLGFSKEFLKTINN